MMTRALSDHIQRAAEAVDEAMRHHQEAAAAHEDGDARTVSLEHAHITRCLRTAQQCFRNIASAAAEQDSANAKTIQTSSGTDVSGGSDNGRAGSPLYSRGNAGVQQWLDRARVGASR